MDVKNNKDLIQLNHLLRQQATALSFRNKKAPVDLVSIDPISGQDIIKQISRAMDETVDRTANKEEEQIDVLYFIQQSFIILNSLILRGELKTVIYIVNFLMNTKTKMDHSSKKSSWVFVEICKVYWIYSVYLFGKVWDMQNLQQDLAIYDSKLTKNSYMSLLVQLEKTNKNDEKLLEIVKQNQYNGLTQ